MNSLLYNCIIDCHFQSFLWRDGEDRDPDIYIVLVNNIGIKPSGTIAGCVLEKTADMFTEKYPKVVEDLKEISYVDDVATEAWESNNLHQHTQEIDEILEAGGMECKGWKYSFEDGESLEIGSGLEGCDGDQYVEKVLGLHWFPVDDTFRFVF